MEDLVCIVSYGIMYTVADKKDKPECDELTVF